MTKKKTAEPETVTPEMKYSKDAIIASVEFLRYRDLLKVLLHDGEMYSIAEAHTIVNHYLNREV